MIINYTKDGKSFSDFDVAKQLLNIINIENSIGEEQTISCSTQNVLYMVQVLRKNNIVKKVSLLFNGVFICEINKVGQIKSENVLPDGFNDLIDKCLSDLLNLKKFEIN